MILIIFISAGEMNLKLDGLERSSAVQELTKTFQEIMVRYININLSLPL